MDLKEADEFYKFLQNGKQPNGFKLNEVPTLSSKGACSIIYFLQERYKIIPPYNHCEVPFKKKPEGYRIVDPNYFTFEAFFSQKIQFITQY